jgi:hypothetical protein
MPSGRGAAQTARLIPAISSWALPRSVSVTEPDVSTTTTTCGNRLRRLGGTTAPRTDGVRLGRW